MRTDPSQKLPGKTQAILLAETKSEQWLSWVRLGCAGAMAIVFVPAWIFKATSQIPLYIQAASIALLAGYSVFYLLYARARRRVAKQYIYLLTLFDVFVITAIILSSIIPCRVSSEIPSVIFGLYFIAIAFTSFHLQ